MASGLFLEYVDPWVNWTWLSTDIPLFVSAVEQHVTLTVIAVGGGLAISIPLGIAAHRWRSLRNPVLAFFDVVYTIPSLALFALLVPYTGLGVVTAEIGLIGYPVLILVRNLLVGLGSVPPALPPPPALHPYPPLPRLFR